MATRSPRATPSPRKKSSLILILLLAFLAALATFYVLHRSPPPTDAPQTPPTPHATTHIYPQTPDPHQQVATALAQAAVEHKRLLLDFGGDWCADCLVLDYYLHQPENADLLAQNFILVHVYIGEQIDQNLDIPAKYNVPVVKGVPALAVLDPQGNVLYSQTTGEFGHMRTMDPTSVTEFLTRWKA